MPVIALDSPLAAMAVAQQVLIGLTLGFAVRLVFAAVEMGGELIGLQVDYVILGGGDKYKVVDIVTEGSSMTKNYYDQFHRMLTTEGQKYPYLVQKLRDKIAAKEKEAAK